MAFARFLQRALITPNFAVQPLAQAIRHPGGEHQAARATMLGLPCEPTF